MASDNLEDVLIQSGVDSALTSSLMMEGWSCQSFRMAAADIQGFEDVLQERSSSTPLSVFQKACLRTAFQSLQPQHGPSASALSTPTLSTTTPAGSWAEAFPPKLENAVLQAMKQKFMANYPSELIHADLFPSTRLVSLVHDQLSKKVWKWVPWKYRISLTRSEEISSNRAQKMPKIDHLGLHSLLFDDPPSIDVSNNAMGVNSIRNMLEVHDRAIALCQGAHLANLKAYTHKFIGFLTAKYDGDLRNPSVLEAQHADQKIWTVIAELMERGWNMDDCLHEMTNLRHDLPSLLQPRPRVFKPLPSPSSQTASPRGDGPKGKGQGKSKGKQNSGKSKGKVQWLTEIQRDGGFKQLCMRYQVDSVETLPVHDVDPVQDFAPPRDSFTQGRLPQPEQDLLRVASSGKVGYGAASPSCCEYSRLKLRDDDGPKALRSPEHLSGLPNLTPWELQRVQESFMMLSRCVEVLTLVFQAGGHVHLEQPLNAMSWLEKVVRQFLQLIGASCINVAACAYEMDVYKAWMFASSFTGLRPLGCICQHPPNSHVRLQGLRDDSGAFASRATAQYPQKLAQLFANLVAPLLDTSALDLQWSSLDALMPTKHLSEYPFAQIDGGGAFSHPDWSQDNRQEHDWFKMLRTSWMNRIISERLDKILLAHVASGNPSPPFSMETLTPFKDDLEKFLELTSPTGRVLKKIYH
ncbi:unnamed protein product [Cladocopium goreaui]|uniref:Uncharacterized protein n=1 Tax=Cladocopium goreaui TaxID=2562237 RepID=A0A9P1DE08_9DINO|nr:unnamed protein product [Cladocopium goreaui]